MKQDFEARLDQLSRDRIQALNDVKATVKDKMKELKTNHDQNTNTLDAEAIETIKLII